MPQTSFKGWEGFYLTAEEQPRYTVTHGPRPGVEGEPSAGPWETFDAQPQPDGTYAFLSNWGRYLSAQPNGAVTADRTWIREWEKFTRVNHQDGGFAWRTHHGTFIRGLSQEARASTPATEPGSSGVDCKAASPGPWEKWVNDGLGSSTGPGSNVAQPLVGQLTIRGRSFADDSGPRRVLGCSFFPAARIYRDNRSRFMAQMDRIAAEGYQVNRIFRQVGGIENGTDPRSVYWRGSGVHHEWPDYDEVLVGTLQAHKDRHIKVHLTAGDMGQTFPGGTGEREFNDRVCHLIRDNGLEDTIAMFEVWNEGWQNNAYGDDPNRAASLAQSIRSILPKVLIGFSTPPSGEEPSGMLAWSPLSNYCNLLPMHGMREFDRGMERAFTLSYWDWEYPSGHRNTKRPIWQGEPVGDGTDVYMDIKRQTPHWQAYLFGFHWVFQMCGQAGMYFNGPAVLYKEPRTLQDEWGFTAIPSLVAPIPEDVGQWPNISHGNKRGTTPLDARQWSTDGRPGVARVDQVWNSHQLVAVVQGGPGPWRPYATRAMRGQTYSKDGPLFQFEAAAGQDLPGDWRADHKVLGVIAEFI